MSKIGLIIGREVKAKLSNKTFIVMTLLAPLLTVGFLGMMIYLSTAEKTEQKVLVLDDSHLFENRLAPNDYITFTYAKGKLDDAVKQLIDNDYTCLLWVAPNLVDGGAGATTLRYKKSPGLGFQTYLKSQMEKILYEERLKANNIDPNIIHNAKQSIKLITEKVADNGSIKDDSSFSQIGFIPGVLMFAFVMIYGMMVFRSVMEEKTNRIVEVIISSVRPFELMMGKIIGVAVVGILQFIAMGLISMLLYSVLSVFFLKDINKNLEQFTQQKELVNKHGTNIDLGKLQKFDEQRETLDLVAKIQNINFAKVFFFFILYFIGGYLFYSSILAAIGSAVDSEADSQQFMFPVMLPQLAGYFLAIKSLMSPDSPALFWGSMIPFTSPIVMMTRIAGDVPYWEIIVSLVILYASFVGMAWLAARIYRTGVLMYGKKITWRELGKWLFYRS